MSPSSRLSADKRQSLVDRLGDNYQLLIDGLARGEYQLLMGAGASLGGTSGSGRDLPSSTGLKEELITDFQLPVDSRDLSLSQIYSHARKRQSRDGLSFESYIKDRFSGCVPPSWQSAIPEFYWKAIWTLNIDDALEATFSNALRQEIVPTNWIDPHRFADLGELLAIHLHGMSIRPDRLVFSVSEYFRAATATPTWHRVFGDHFVTDPFLVIGARLSDEVDLVPILERGSTSMQTFGRPSVVLLKEIPDLAAESFVEMGLIPVAMEASDFFDAIDADVRIAERKLSSVLLRSAKPLTAEAASFLNQFRRLSLNDSTTKSSTDFYLGFDPTWGDILDRKDAVLQVVHEVTSEVVDLRARGSAYQRLLVLHGDWGTGKTTALLRVGRELAARGMDVFLFRAEEAIDVQAVAWYQSNVPNSVLLFDGAADFADGISDILHVAERSGYDSLIIASERESRIRQIRSAIPASFVSDEGSKHIRRLSDVDIDEIIAKLDERSRLGVLFSCDAQERKAHFTKFSRRHLFTAMSTLSGGTGFEAKLRAARSRQTLSSAEREVLGVAAFPGTFGYSVPLSVVSNIVGCPVIDLVSSVDNGELVEWCVIDRTGLRLKHRHIASIIANEILPIDERYRLTRAIALQIAPMVSPAAISARTLAYRITKTLLDADHAKRWLHRRTLDWYAELEVAHGWNARYWEQRALACVASGLLEEARSYAEKAAGLFPDSFALTTLSNVMLRQLRVDVEHGAPLDLHAYWAAIEQLETGVKLKKFSTDHQFSVFFNQTLGLCEALRETHGIPDAIRDEVNRWLTLYRLSPFFGYPEFQKRYNEILARVLLAFAVD